MKDNKMESRTMQAKRTQKIAVLNTRHAVLKEQSELTGKKIYVIVDELLETAMIMRRWIPNKEEKVTA